MKLTKCLFFLTLVLSFVVILGCELEPDVSEIDPEEIINLTILSAAGDTITTDSTIKANGQRELRMVVQIDPNAATANRMVVFKQKGGSFVGEASETPSVERVALSDGSVEVIYRVGGTSGTYILSAEIKSQVQYRSEKALVLSPLSNTDVIEAELNRDTLKANGIDTTSINIRVRNTSEKSVELSSNAFNFEGEQEVGKRTLTLNADGTATVKLTTKSTPGNHVIRVKLGGFERLIPIVLERITSDEVITLTADKTTFIGSGLDKTRINVALGNTKSKEIVLSSGGGSFPEQSGGMRTLELNNEGEGSIEFTAGQMSGNFFIKGVVDDFEVLLPIIVTPITSEDVISSFTADRSSGTVKADAASSITFSVEVANTAETAIEFSVSANGGEFAPNSNKVETTLVGGRANAILNVGHTSGRYQITAKVGDVTRVLEYDLIRADVADFYEVLFTNTDGLLADGASTFGIAWNQVNPVVSSVDLTVVGGGTFVVVNSAMNNFTLGETDRVRVGKVPGTYYLTANAADIMRDTLYTVEVVRAFPDFLNLTSSAFEIDSLSENSITLTATVERLTGSSSDDTVIEFLAYQNTTDNVVGTFGSKIVKTGTDNTGIVAFRSNVPGVDKAVPITIRATIRREGQPDMQQEVNINVK